MLVLLILYSLVVLSSLSLMRTIVTRAAAFLQIALRGQIKRGWIVVEWSAKRRLKNGVAAVVYTALFSVLITLTLVWLANILASMI